MEAFAVEKETAFWLTPGDMRPVLDGPRSLGMLVFGAGGISVLRLGQRGDGESLPNLGRDSKTAAEAPALSTFCLVGGRSSKVHSEVVEDLRDCFGNLVEGLISGRRPGATLGAAELT